jgi:hypothetical protein
MTGPTVILPADTVSKAALRSVQRNRRASPAERIVAALVSLACAGVLTVAWWLTPSTGGLGTHQQLGLPPCAWKVMWGFPCMTCGMTTAFSHAAHGDLIASIRTQPMGCVLAILTSVICWAAAHTAASGSRALDAALRLLQPRTLMGLGAMLLAAWGYTIWMHAAH